jgi:hypothetical protein
MIDALEVKSLLQSLKLHFSTEAYDAVRYNYSVRPLSQEAKQAFLRNNQRHLFGRVGKHADPKGLIVSNLLENPKLFITDLLTADAAEIYQAWKTRQTKLTYLFKEDLEREDLYLHITKMDDNGMPHLLSQYIRKQVSPETIVILDTFSHKLDTWRDSTHPLVAKMQLRLRKYRPFVEFDKNRATEVLKSLKHAK